MSAKDTKPHWPAELDKYAAEQFVASLPDTFCDDLIVRIWAEVYGSSSAEEKLAAITKILSS